MAGATQSGQARAVQAFRKRLTARGLARFEVVGRPEDRGLIRALAKVLAGGDAAALQTRAAVVNHLNGAGPGGETVVAALRRSPWMGADVRLTRVPGAGRRIKF